MEAFLPSNKREDFLLIERARAHELKAKVREVREAKEEFLEKEQAHDILSHASW